MQVYSHRDDEYEEHDSDERDMPDLDKPNGNRWQPSECSAGVGVEG